MVEVKETHRCTLAGKYFTFHVSTYACPPPNKNKASLARALTRPEVYTPTHAAEPQKKRTGGDATPAGSQRHAETCSEAGIRTDNGERSEVTVECINATMMR